ncbi:MULTISPECIES: S-type pyocin domain-containing protein [unclassified Pseudomonas]|uniref:S-type pyocin domain-containing protein n=1 Tax=unclassified Pseudomonas TaxID=196821 RepID=UPI00102075EC|nr:S-type pyocin domain-containing protein [Pseudomonas sp. SWI36]
MSPQGFTELPDSHVHGTRPIFVPGVFWGHNRIPYQLVSSFRPGSLVIDLIPQIENDKRQVKQAHEQRQAALDQDLDQAILAQAGSLAGLSEVQAIERRIAAISQLQTQLGQRLEAARQQANSFYGKAPEHRSFQEFLAVTRAPNGPADPRTAWLASYRAAFEAKLLEQQSSELIQRQHRLRSALSAARLKEGNNRKIDQTLYQTEQALVRILAASHEFQIARSALQDLLTAFTRHLHEDIAEEAALEHSRELVQETSGLLRARARLVQAYSTWGRLHSLLEVEAHRIDFALRVIAVGTSADRRPELLALQAQAAEHASTSSTDATTVRQLRDQADIALQAAFDEQAVLAALSGHTPSNTPITFNAWTASTRHPVILSSSRGGTAEFELIWESLAESIGKTAQRLLTGAALTAIRHASLMLYATRLGDGERMGVTVPLAMMTPGADLTLEANRKVGQNLELPLRMNAIPQGNQTELYLAATDGSGVLRDVRVRQAQWDPTHGAYRFTAEGPGGATLLWHPATPPSTLGQYDDERGTYIPGATIVEDLQTHLPGNIIVPPEPDIRTFPGLPDLHIDDYVIVFPADSGLAPIYVMLRNPRNLPGVASGNGVSTPDRVLDAATTAAGAPIPARIAEKLRGRRFTRFDKLKEAIWREIAADDVLRQHIRQPSIDDMMHGKAPYAPESHWVGKRMKLEIHHKIEISKGGAVYDFDNLVFMTPRVHIDHHKAGNQ